MECYYNFTSKTYAYIVSQFRNNRNDRLSRAVPEEEIYDIIRDMKCERCKNENNQIKLGRTKAGSQKT